jgi:MATE family multidrug resistance protein
VQVLASRERSRGGSTVGEWSEQIKLAIPLAGQQIGVQLMGSVDAALLGHYSESALAGSSIGNNLLFAITAVGWGIVMGLDTVVPQAIGAGKMEDARRSLSAGIRLAVLVGLVSMVLAMASPYILLATSTPADVVHDARIYLWVRSLGAVPFLVTIAQRSYLAARSTTRPLIIAVVAGNIVNALLDLLLIFVFDLGVIGAASATLGVQIMQVAVYQYAIRSLDHGERLPRTRSEDMKPILRYGLPVGGQLLAEIGIFGVATVLAAHLGKTPSAAHSIALMLSSFTFSVTVGIGAAASVRVGHAVGAGDPALARRRGIIGLQTGLMVMALFAIAFVTVPAVLSRLFTSDDVVIAAAVPLLQIAALFQLSDGTQAIASGALRGLGATRPLLVGNLFGHYGVGLVVMIALAFGAGLGAPGLWWGLSAGLTTTALYLVVVFLRRTARSSQ